MVSTSNELHYYFSYKHGCRHDCPKKTEKEVTFNYANDIHTCSHGANDMEKVKANVPLFLHAFVQCV